MEFHEEAGGWTLSLEGWTVTMCMVDYAFSLVLMAERDAETVQFRIELPFQLSSPDQQWTLAAALDPGSLGPALTLLHQIVTSASVSPTSTLELHFVNGMALRVDPHPEGMYEAWDLSGNYGTMMVCMPNGELAVWMPPDSVKPPV
jgi:hypothetical protein